MEDKFDYPRHLVWVFRPGVAVWEEGFASADLPGVFVGREQEKALGPFSC